MEKQRDTETQMISTEAETVTERESTLMLHTYTRMIIQGMAVLKANKRCRCGTVGTDIDKSKVTNFISTTQIKQVC